MGLIFNNLLLPVYCLACVLYFLVFYQQNLFTAEVQ